MQKVNVNDKIKKYKRKIEKEHAKMTEARTVGGVHTHTHTHTNSSIEIRAGEKALINDIKNKINDRL